jgi:hypothetical protein
MWIELKTLTLGPSNAENGIEATVKLFIHFESHSVCCHNKWILLFHLQPPL